MPKKAQKPAFDRTQFTTISIPNDVYAKLKEMADAEDRKISRQVTRYILKAYEERSTTTA
jgi:predicted CopG family antitoxin